jgi:parallel beta-helix repeat protein
LTLRSAGDDSPGKFGLKRAEATVIDGGLKSGTPGVMLSENCTLDGFTVTNVGRYDDARWKKHYETRGEDLKDDEGAVGTAASNPAVGAVGVTCTIRNNIVHHNGHAGIGLVGRKGRLVMPVVRNNVVYRNMGGGIGIANAAAAIVRENRCFENLRAGIGCRNADPVIIGNTCYGNVRAGIGCREGATPVIRGNTCYRNRRAGIGIRMKGTRPVVENNRCYENGMAGIGSRDGAKPIVVRNECQANTLAGIGTRSGADALILDNHCRRNLKAGIGIREKARAIVIGNRCIENKLVAIGVRQGSAAHIAGNELQRTGGVPPLVALRDSSSATVRDNTIRGGGVAAVLVQGNARVESNRFAGKGKGQGTAVWVWAKSKASIIGNTFDGYRTAVNAAKSDVAVIGNSIRRFQRSAIVVKDGTTPAHVFGNKASTSGANQRILDIHGPAGVVAGNVLQK